MGRPSKHNWEAIQNAYENGFTRDEIVNKFNVTKKLLTDKIALKKWVVKSNVNSVVEDFKAQSLLMAENYSEHEEVKELFEDKLNTINSDNELVSNNRKLAKLLQGVIVQQKGGITLQNIKNVSGVLKDIESIANPAANKLEVNTQNNIIENTTQIEVRRIESKS